MHDGHLALGDGIYFFLVVVCVWSFSSLFLEEFIEGLLFHRGIEVLVSLCLVVYQHLNRGDVVEILLFARFHECQYLLKHLGLDNCWIDTFCWCCLEL